MASILRFRKLCCVEPENSESFESKKCGKKEEIVDSTIKQSFDSQKYDKKEEIVNPDTKNELEINNKRRKRKPKAWSCIDCGCRMIGYIWTTWWLILFLYHSLQATLPESVGDRLKREGLTAKHPVILVPGTITGGLELWEGRPCAHGLFRKRLWGGTFSGMFRRPSCWLDHMSLDNETGLDPPGIRVRPIPGLAAADYFAPGFFVWAVLIENLAKIGYEGKNLYMATYDWRISFQNTEIRDHSLSKLKSKIEFMYGANGNKKVVVVPHSMGVQYFLYFLKWVEAPSPMGGGGSPGWCNKYIKSIMNIGPTFLGTPKAITHLLSGENKYAADFRARFPGIWDSETPWFHTMENCLRVLRTWDSLFSMMPKGGETIWGNLDWSPEVSSVNDSVKYGRIVSFSKAASELPSSQLPSFDSKELFATNENSRSSCEEVWTEYDEINRENIRKFVENKAFTVASTFDLLRFVAPKMMQRLEAQFSNGIADDLDDPKYEHYKYWSNSLETRLPNAPELEIYCLYGVGLPTERSYIYKLSATDRCKILPFRIDASVDGEEDSNLKRGVFFADGDESVPVISAGYMCAKGWRGKTKFNPSGSATYVREYQHKPPASLLEGRGTESGSHADLMGNVALIEDVLRVAAGATGPDIGGDRIHSDLIRMSEKINLRL